MSNIWWANVRNLMSRCPDLEKQMSQKVKSRRRLSKCTTTPRLNTELLNVLPSFWNNSLHDDAGDDDDAEDDSDNDEVNDDADDDDDGDVYEKGLHFLRGAQYFTAIERHAPTLA